MLLVLFFLFLEFIGRLFYVGDMEERGPLYAYLDKGGLHAREDPYYLALVDVPGYAPVLDALDIELDEAALLDEGDPCLERV